MVWLQELFAILGKGKEMKGAREGKGKKERGGEEEKEEEGRGEGRG